MMRLPTQNATVACMMQVLAQLRHPLQNWLHDDCHMPFSGHCPSTIAAVHSVELSR